MTTENPNKIDMNKERTLDQWNNLLHSVKMNPNDPSTGKEFLTKDEQDFYVDEINYQITGERHTEIEILKSIQEGSADIEDIEGMN